MGRRHRDEDADSLGRKANGEEQRRLAFRHRLHPVAVLGVWAGNEVSDTGRWVATVEPLIHDPAIQNVLTDKITKEITSQLNLTGTVTGVAAPRLVPGAIAATSPARSRKKPAEAAWDPDGETYVTTGTLDWSIAEVISRVDVSRPPGVERPTTTRATFSRSAERKTFFK